LLSIFHKIIRSRNVWIATIYNYFVGSRQKLFADPCFGLQAAAKGEVKQNSLLLDSPSRTKEKNNQTGNKLLMTVVSKHEYKKSAKQLSTSVDVNASPMRVQTSGSSHKLADCFYLVKSS